MSQDLIYITPRLVLVKNLQHSSYRLDKTHGKYFYLFNLSPHQKLTAISQNGPSVVLFPENSVYIKNRGFPYSFKVVLQLCMSLERYFYKGVSNTAAIYCPQNSLGICVVICYMYTTGRWKQMSEVMEYVRRKYFEELPQRWLLNFEELFDNMSIVLPPIKILKRVVLESEEEIIPLFQVLRQSRFQQLQSVYHHPILEDIQQYQHHILKAHHHTKKPQTSHVFKPVILAGDFKLDLYSYKELRYQSLMTIGFNTIFVDTDTIVFEGSDLVENALIEKKVRVVLQFDDYCLCTSDMLYSKRCVHCVQELKNIKKEYGELVDLSCQFNRNRKKEIASQLVFGNPKFDDAKKY